MLQPEPDNADVSHLYDERDTCRLVRKGVCSARSQHSEVIYIGQIPVSDFCPGNKLPTLALIVSRVIIAFRPGQVLRRKVG